MSRELTVDERATLKKLSRGITEHDKGNFFSQAEAYLHFAFRGKEAEFDKYLPLAESTLELIKANHEDSKLVEISSCEQVDLSEMVRERTALYKPLLTDQKEIMVNLKCPEKAPVECLPHVKIAFGNLLHNASKYADPETALNIDLTDGSDSYRLAVESTGTPIESELRQRLCKEQVASTGGGSGKGLELSAGIVVLSGGKMYLEDAGADPRVSTFVIELPK